MPLPQNGADWPPKHIDPAFQLMAIHDAWWVGQADELASVYSSDQWRNHRAQYAGGIVGFGARLWWGKPQANGESRVKLHLPLAADIATMSADLLFSEPPRVVLKDASKIQSDGTVIKSAEQEQIEAVVNRPEVYTTLLEAAEVAAALGGAYLRLVWDRNRMDHVGIEAIHADNAVPVFRSGFLQEVLFWTEVSDAGDSRVLRHVELHEPGKITHALYAGNKNQLGEQVPFTEAQSTNWLDGVVDAEDGSTRVDGMTRVLATGVADGISACYVPNIRPNREFRKNGFLRNLGRSDYAGIEPAFDAIDEAWSSWARDVRLAKARILVPNSYLEGQGPGSGAYFDTEREVYEGLDFLTTDPGAKSINPQQFKIRNVEHESTITEWTRYVLRSAGYSPSSLGERDGGVQRTATEVTAEERLSDRTRDKKINYWKAALSDFVRVWLQIEASVFDGPVLQEKPEIRFPVESQQDPAEAAQIAALMATSQSASVMTRVRHMHPEWDGDTVNLEVERIYKESGIGVTEPDAAAYRGILENAARSPMDEEEAAEMRARIQERTETAAAEAEAAEQERQAREQAERAR